MSVILYVAQDSGNLKYIAEVEGTDDAAEALTALLEDRPRLNHESYIAICGTFEDGVVETLTQQEEVRVAWSSSRANGAGVEVEDDDEEADEEEAPAPPKRRGPGRPPGSKNKPKAATGARRGPGRPKGSKNKPKSGRKSPFTKSAKGDD